MEEYEDEEIYDDATAITDGSEETQKTESNKVSPPVWEAAQSEVTPSESSFKLETTSPVSVKDRLKMFNTNSNYSGLPVGPKPVLPKKGVVTARSAQFAPDDETTKSELNPPTNTQNSEKVAKWPKPIPTGAKPKIPTGAKPIIPTGGKPIIPTGAKPTLPTGGKPTSPASKSIFKEPEINASSRNLVSELKSRQNSLKPSLCQSDSGATFRKQYFVAEHESGRPDKPKSLSVEDVDLPGYTFSTSCNGCNDVNSAPIRTNPTRPTNDQPQIERISEKIKSLTEEEELALDGDSGGGSGGSRIPGGDTAGQDWYDDANPGQLIEEEQYDTCDIDGPNSPNHLQNGNTGGSTANHSLKEQPKIDREMSKKEKKLVEKQKKIQKQQEELCKKYKLSDEDINSNEIVKCAERINEGKHLPFSLNHKQAVFLVKKMEKNKWIIKNQDGTLGIVNASKMEEPEVHEQIQDDYEQEDLYEEV